jgi:hypothetical protein
MDVALDGAGEPAERSDERPTAAVHPADLLALDRLVMDYLVVEGFQEAASVFAEEAGLAADRDLSAVAVRMQVYHTITHTPSHTITHHHTHTPSHAGVRRFVRRCKKARSRMPSRW